MAGSWCPPPPTPPLHPTHLPSAPSCLQCVAYGAIQWMHGCAKELSPGRMLSFVQSVVSAHPALLAVAFKLVQEVFMAAASSEEVRVQAVSGGVPVSAPHGARGRANTSHPRKRSFASVP